MTPDITINDLTTGVITGDGVFDKLMASAKAHLDAEFKKGAIRGPEYSQVYLGQTQQVLSTALQFLSTKAKIGLEAKLLEQQVLLAQIEVTKAGIALEILGIEKLKASAEVLHIEAQTALVKQQGLNLTAEGLNIPKQGLVLDAQKAQIAQQTLNAVSENLSIVAKTDLTEKQAANEVIQSTVLVAQECKLRAEFDLTMNTVTKTTGEIALLAQKVITEKAQTQSMGIDADSVVGKQKNLYQAQADGFARDAEQKAAKLMLDTWNARRMTDEGTVADSTNKLDDANVGRFVQKLAAGIGV